MRKDLFIIGDGGYSKAVRWASVDWKAPIRGINTTVITRENWDEIKIGKMHLMRSIAQYTKSIDQKKYF